MGRWTHTFHDALRRVVAVRDPAARTITYDWCNCGSLESLVDAEQNETRWEHDDQGRVIREIRADDSETVFVYVGNRTQKITLGFTEDYDYDAAQQLVSVKRVGATPNRRSLN